MNSRVAGLLVTGTVLVLVAGCGLIGGSDKGGKTFGAESTPSVTISSETPPFSAPTVATTPNVTTPSPSTSTTPAESALVVANRTVAQNRLYRAGAVPASRCKEPTERATSVAQLRAYYTEFVHCLDRAWAPVVRKAGYKFWAPKVEILVGDQRRSQCSISDSAAYCGGVISLQATFDLSNQRRYNKLWTRTTMAFLVAHEYGHHIQQLTGIMDASQTRTNYARGTSAQLLESRRLELQASCFSGVYLGADRKYFPASGAWLQKWNWTVANRGDEWNPTRSHGNKANHSRWSRKGFGAGNPAACNTFTASAASVA
ncbi:neutral zinc metallopeptidase [Kribbella sp. NPDC020789]